MLSFFDDMNAGALRPHGTSPNGDDSANGSDSTDSDAPFYFDDEPQKSKRRPRWRAIVGYSLTAIFLAGVSYAFNAPTPYVIEQPGTVFNVLGSDSGSKIITIKGAKSYDDSGKLYLLTVELVGRPGSTPSWVDVLQAWNDPKKHVIPIEWVYPSDVKATDSTNTDLEMMKDSQQQATAAALRELGYEIPNKINVVQVTKKAPADGLLEVGDFITKVDGIAIPNGDTLRAEVRKHATKKPLDLTILRGEKTFEVSVTPKKLNGAWRMGIAIVDSYVFPIDVSLQLQNVGGPSGGMMFALGIIDKLTPGSLTGGQVVAGTGEINGNGEVGPIGGIQQKMWAAVDKGATWFLAPAENCDEVVGNIPDGLHVTKVSKLADALAALKAIAANPNTTSLPQCSLAK